MNNRSNIQSKAVEFSQILVYVGVMLLILCTTSLILTAIFGNNIISFALFLAFATFYSTNQVYERVSAWLITNIVKIGKLFKSMTTATA